MKILLRTMLFIGLFTLIVQVLLSQAKPVVKQETDQQEIKKTNEEPNQEIKTAKKTCKCCNHHHETPAVPKFDEKIEAGSAGVDVIKRNGGTSPRRMTTANSQGNTVDSTSRGRSKSRSGSKSPSRSSKSPNGRTGVLVRSSSRGRSTSPKGGSEVEVRAKSPVRSTSRGRSSKSPERATTKK